MEICTYIVEGSLTHKDSTGTRETIGRGGIQFMVRPRPSLTPIARRVMRRRLASIAP